MDTKTKSFIRRKSKLLLCIENKGGLCNICGKNLTENYWEADFHHISAKEKGVGELISKNSWDDCLLELENCQLVCCACHRKIHNDFDRFEIYKDEIQLYVESLKNGKTMYGKSIQKKKITKNMKLEWVDLYNKGTSIKQISELSGYNYESVRRSINEFIGTDKHKQKLDSKTLEEKFIELWNNNVSRNDMSSLLKCGKDAITSKSKRLIKKGIINPRPRNLHRRKK